MPKEEKDLRRLVRVRMARTGERYSSARAALLATQTAGADAVQLPVELGAALREARLSRQWTLGDAAGRAETGRLKLDLLERGATSLDPVLATRLCRVLDLAPATARLLRACAAAADVAERASRPDESSLGELLALGAIRVTCADRCSTVLTYFAIDGSRVYAPEDLGERAQWLRAICADPHVTVEARGQVPRYGSARILTAGPDRTSATEVLASRYPHDVEWFVDASIVELDLNRPAVRGGELRDGRRLR